MLACLVVCTAGLTALAACSSAPSVPPPSQTMSADADALEAAVLPVLTEQMAEMGVPGLVAVVQSPDRGSYEVAVGVSDVATGEPMTLADRFRIGSISKTLTATVVLQLVQEGAFDLDDPLATFFPEVDTNGATVRHALNMTAGIPTYTTYPFLNALADRPDRVWSPRELLATIDGLPAEFPPGTDFDYSNSNYVLLGLLAEQHGGASLGELVHARIFTPLRMTGCSIPAADDATMPEPFSHGYQYGTRWDEPTPPAAMPELVDVTEYNPSWGFGAGEAICTASDMAIWGAALVDGDLLDAGMQAERLTFFANDSLPYGLGIADLNGLVGHHAHMSGFQSQTSRRASDGTVIVVLTNITQAPDGELPATKISELISRAIPAP